jgi:hypothetical protein
MESLDALDLSKLAISYSGTYCSFADEVFRFSIQSLTAKEILSHGSFRFLDLPTEVRHRVLHFTDLVLPFREVMWDDDGLVPNYGCSGTDRLPDSRCWKQEFCCQDKPGLYPPCTCYRAPWALFLVCRMMTEDARQVFYSSNRFVLSCIWTSPYRSEASYFFSRVERFTNSVPAHCIYNIRELEIFLPFWAYDGMDSDMIYDLEKAIQNLAQNMGRLSLAVHVDVDIPHYCTVMCTSRDSSPLSHRFATQYLLIERFEPFRRLASFFVFIGSLRYKNTPIDQQVARDQGRVLEQLVMGDAYNALDHGKLLRRKSRCEIGVPFADENMSCTKV